MSFKAIDPKYGIECREEGAVQFQKDATIRIVKTATGEPIPEDEPLILLRARDKFALSALLHYRQLCEQDNCTDYHMRGIDNRIAAFKAFAYSHNERMKQPGITKGM